MKSNPKLLVFNPFFYKLNTTTPTLTPRLYLFAFFTLFTFTFTLTFLKPTFSPQPSTPTTTTPLSATLSAALIHYATASANAVRMSPSEITAISTTLHNCNPNCNLLVFGFSHEFLLWHSLNSPSPSPFRRTVFLDENQYLVSTYELNFTDIEAYDVAFTTKVAESQQLINHARAHRNTDCKPVQNLLFSDCKLAINDLPNHLYSIPWDVIIVDGPRGYSGNTPGRMSPIFTAAVLARTPTKPVTSTPRTTHVFVHDYGRDVEKTYTEEFLCKENLVEVKRELAHFAIKERKLNDDLGFRFCAEENLSSSS